MTLLALALLTGCRGEPLWPTEPAPARCDPDGLPAGETVLPLTHESLPRNTLVWAPRTAGPHDLVVSLHDFRGDPRRQAHYSGWVAFAAEAGAVLAAPDGRSATWNVGNGCCGRAAEKSSADRELLDRVATTLDETACTSGRLLATGIGNGAMMAHRWACESDAVDAVVSVGGALQLDDCPVTRPIPVVHYHGDADRQYPAAGSEGWPEQGPVKPASAALDLWKRRNRVTGDPVHTEQGALSCDRWDGDAPVVWCTVRGMKDIWPGSSEWPSDPAVPLSDAAAGPWREVIVPWWDAHLPR